MAGKLDVYDMGGGGVNVVKDPLQLSDNEFTQIQNGEYNPDAVVAGKGALSKRGGLQALNGSALAGSVTGLVASNLKTTYTRSLLAARGSEDANTFMRSTNGTVWADIATPLALALDDKFDDQNGARDARRLAAFKLRILYVGNDFTQNTDKVPVNSWDGTNALEITEIGLGPSGNAVPYIISDALAANGRVYLAVHDPGGSTPNLCGRVLSLNLETGELTQIASSFGGGTGEMSGGYPSALAYYQSQLWVGLNNGATTNGIGKIVRCYPDIDTVWTSDVANLTSSISTLGVFLGDLFAGTQSSVSAGATISRRSASAGTWSTVATSASGAGGDGHYASMMVYSNAGYMIEYFSGGTDVVHIVTSTDGTTWTTDRDVDSVDGVANPPQLPGSGALFNDGADLYYVIRASSVSATDGFILRKNAGAWAKVATDNFGGPIGVLVERS